MSNITTSLIFDARALVAAEDDFVSLSVLIRFIGCIKLMEIKSCTFKIGRLDPDI